MRRFLLLSVLVLTACAPSVPTNDSAFQVTGSASTIAWDEAAAMRDLPTTKQEWLKRLTPAQYNVLFEAGTERPFSSPLNDEHRPGTFVSADCGEPLFRSEQKYDSGTGWPSFWAPITPDAVVLDTDTLLGYERTEVKSRCGGHLGHVFDDGPPPTGLRYCMNGLALRFIPDAATGATAKNAH